MRKIETNLEGLYILENQCFDDERGSFQKLFNDDFFKENDLSFDCKEIYFSASNRNVIRGMHFQIPPMDHEKVVFVSAGRIVDVVLDIRSSSSTYGRYFAVELNNKDGRYLYIPKGFAHGFLSLDDNTIVNYAQTSCYSNVHDAGIRFDSFGYFWGVDYPIISARDENFVSFLEFNSPFK